jgi:DHA1 family tetracycline resistance protein-like MFS transporter
VGERRTALAGIAIAALGYLGYATATAGWMMFAWLGTWLFGALVMPVTNALMSHRVAADAQGELQGAVASLYSLSSIVGPPLMTQLFGRFSAPTAAVHLPGAAFLAAAAIALVCLVIYWQVTQQRVSQEVEAGVVPTR